MTYYITGFIIGFVTSLLVCGLLWFAWEIKHAPYVDGDGNVIKR